VKADVHGTWSVFDAVTEDAAEMLGVFLTGLSEELALDMTDLLNAEERTKRSELED
jgi:hypothetical protein